MSIAFLISANEQIPSHCVRSVFSTSQFSFEHSLGKEEKEGKIFAALVLSATEFLIGTFYKHLIFYNQYFL